MSISGCRSDALSSLLGVDLVGMGDRVPQYRSRSSRVITGATVTPEEALKECIAVLEKQGYQIKGALCRQDVEAAIWGAKQALKSLTWTRRSKQNAPECCQVVPHGPREFKCHFMDGQQYRIDKVNDGEWAGPIEEPK